MFVFFVFLLTVVKIAAKNEKKKIVKREENMFN